MSTDNTESVKKDKKKVIHVSKKKSNEKKRLLVVRTGIFVLADMSSLRLL